MRTINEAGLTLIEQFEGCKLQPYLDVAKIPTIGIGTTRYPDGKAVTMNDPPITEAQAQSFLKSHLEGDCKAVSGFVKVDVTDNEFAALVSFAYNVGRSALASSTLLKKLNSGDKKGAADQFLKWDHAGGKVVKGLTRRRIAERDLFISL
jgi:GH24 family phage-related lysozyme (muramidase)